MLLTAWNRLETGRNILSPMMVSDKLAAVGGIVGGSTLLGACSLDISPSSIGGRSCSTSHSPSSNGSLGGIAGIGGFTGSSPSPTGTGAMRPVHKRESFLYRSMSRSIGGAGGGGGGGGAGGTVADGCELALSPAHSRNSSLSMNDP